MVVVVEILQIFRVNSYWTIIHTGRFLDSMAYNFNKLQALIKIQSYIIYYRFDRFRVKD